MPSALSYRLTLALQDYHAFHHVRIAALCSYTYSKHHEDVRGWLEVHKCLNNADAFVAGDFMRTYENLVTDLLEDNVRVMVYVGVGMPALPLPIDTRAFTG